MKATLISILSIIQLNLLAQIPTYINSINNDVTCTEILKEANETEFNALLYIVGNDYSEWSNNKRISKSKQEYLRAAETYSIAESMNCTDNYKTTYRIVNCLCQAENFEEAEKLLKPLLTDSKLNSEFFTYYFMVSYKESQLKELRENDFVRTYCGNDFLYDRESYIEYTRNIAKNLGYLYQNKNYNLVLDYVKNSKIIIDKSSNEHLNTLNADIIKIILESLKQTKTKKQIEEEYKRSIKMLKNGTEISVMDSEISKYTKLDFFNLELLKMNTLSISAEDMLYLKLFQKE